jgi:hypothetical protein
MGFDRICCIQALEATSNNVDQAIEKLVNGEIFVAPDVKQLMELGFDYDECKAKLAKADGNMELAMDMLLNGPGEKIMKAPDFSKGSINFLTGLVANFRNIIANYTLHCCICHAKHSCNR